METYVEVLVYDPQLTATETVNWVKLIALEVVNAVNAPLVVIGKPATALLTVYEVATITQLAWEDVAAASMAGKV